MTKCTTILLRHSGALRPGRLSVGKGQLELRTQFYFRERLSRHIQEQGENPLDKAFEQVTDEQLSAYHLKTDKQWMDSFQIASKTDQSRYAEDFAPYIKGHAGHYVDRIKTKKTSHIWNALAARWMRLLGDTVAEQVASRLGYQLVNKNTFLHFRCAFGAFSTVEPLPACRRSKERRAKTTGGGILSWI